MEGRDKIVVLASFVARICAARTKRVWQSRNIACTATKHTGERERNDAIESCRVRAREGVWERGTREGDEGESVGETRVSREYCRI